MLLKDSLTIRTGVKAITGPTHQFNAIISALASEHKLVFKASLPMMDTEFNMETLAHHLGVTVKNGTFTIPTQMTVTDLETAIWFATKTRKTQQRPSPHGEGLLLWVGV